MRRAILLNLFLLTLPACKEDGGELRECGDECSEPDAGSDVSTDPEDTAPDEVLIYPGTYLGDMSWHLQRGTSCSPNATGSNRCSYACIDPVPPPPSHGGPNPWNDPSHGLSCCACTSWYGGCGDPNWCAVNGPGVGVYKADPVPTQYDGVVCPRASDPSGNTGSNPASYCASCVAPNGSNWRGHNAGADGECGNEDDVYNQEPDTADAGP